MSVLSQNDVIKVILHCIQGLLEAYFTIKSQRCARKRIHYLCDGQIEKPSLVITICHRLASLMMLNGDHWDGFFYPTLTLVIDSYILLQKNP